MNSFILFLVLVNILLLTMYKKPQYSVIMILLSLVLFFIIIHYKNYRENFTTLEKIDNAMDNSYYKNTWAIGPYSDLLLASNNTEKKFPLQDPKTFGVYQGNVPLKDNKESKSIDVKDMLDQYQYPPVDGVNCNLKSNFMFAFNQSSPLCCPSTFSTSSGCVCLTEAQKQLIGNRGTAYNK